MILIRILVSILIIAYATELINAQAQDNTEICTQPRVVGKCRGMFPRFWFNSETNQCEQFTYGGCDANANNFLTLEECQSKCGGSQASTTNPGPEKRKFPSDICQQPRKVGKCRGIFPRFFFNSQSNQCEPFVYGGCDGNQNNFEEIEDCVNVCMVDQSIPSGDLRSGSTSVIDSVPAVSGPRSGGKCELPKVTGKCRAYIPRFWYNAARKQCEFFVYGGCGGNENNFDTEDECKIACAAGPDMQSRNGAAIVAPVKTGLEPEKKTGVVAIIYKIYHFFIPYHGEDEIEITTSSASMPVVNVVFVIMSVMIPRMMGMF